jgi:Uma2 family endonuclease
MVWTSGGIDKLAIYARLGVREVWFWRRGRLTAHVLRAGESEEGTQSQLLPGIDRAELASHLDSATASQAMRDYRAAIQSRRAQL